MHIPIIRPTRVRHRWRGTRTAPEPEIRAPGALEHFAEMLEAEARAADVAPALLKALCWHASGWRQFEPDGRTVSAVAPSGANWGCMQLSDVWHPDAFPAAKTDAHASIRYAARLVAWLIEQTGGDERRAVIAFFGHDRAAELAARRVERIARTQPWAAQLTAQAV